MFSEVLFQHLQANFTSFGSKSIQWGFGEVPENTQQPYIVFNELDDNQDPETLCETIGDSGDYFLQCNIFTDSFILNNSIKKLVSTYLYSLLGTELTDGTNSYTIDVVNHSSSPSAETLNNGLAVDVLAKTINYTKNN